MSQATQQFCFCCCFAFIQNAKECCTHQTRKAALRSSDYKSEPVCMHTHQGFVRAFGCAYSRSSCRWAPASCQSLVERAASQENAQIPRKNRASREQTLQVIHLFRTGTLPMSKLLEDQFLFSHTFSLSSCIL